MNSEECMGNELNNALVQCLATRIGEHREISKHTVAHVDLADYMCINFTVFI